MNHHNNIIIVVTVSIFVIIFLCCKCSGENRIHSHGRLRRFFSSIGFDDTNEDEQRCDALCHEYSCRREYIQTRARYFLSCVSDIDGLSQYPCARHRNGTLCEVLVQRYFTRNRYYYYEYSYPDSNQSCSYSECSVECSMILQRLKETWGCCFHEMAEARGWEYQYSYHHNKGFTMKIIPIIIGTHVEFSHQRNVITISLTLRLIQLNVQPWNNIIIFILNTYVFLFLNSSAKLNLVLICITELQPCVPWRMESAVRNCFSFQITLLSCSLKHVRSVPERAIFAHWVANQHFSFCVITLAAVWTLIMEQILIRSFCDMGSGSLVGLNHQVSVSV